MSNKPSDDDEAMRLAETIMEEDRMVLAALANGTNGDEQIGVLREVMQRRRKALRELSTR